MRIHTDEMKQGTYWHEKVFNLFIFIKQNRFLNIFNDRINVPAYFEELIIYI